MSGTPRKEITPASLTDTSGRYAELSDHISLWESGHDGDTKSANGIRDGLYLRTQPAGVEDLSAHLQHLEETVARDGGSNVDSQLALAEALWMHTGDDDTIQRALHHYGVAASLARAAGDPHKEAEISMGHGFGLFTLGRKLEALKHFRFARDVASGDGNDGKAAFAQYWIDTAVGAIDYRSSSVREKIQMRFASRPHRGCPLDVGLSDTVACAICIRTEVELGRPLQWVFAGCGHRCLCKPCLRKMKSKIKNASIECPMCRQCSKVVLVKQYAGTVFSG